MMNKNKMNKIFAPLFACVLLLSACGDDDGGSTGKKDASTTVDSGSQIDSGSKTDAGGVVATCDDYCTNALANCTGAVELFADMASCMTACAAMPAGEAGAEAGNSVTCRAYHSGAPAMGDATTHCPHASTTSDSDVCGSTCDAYCDQVLANCTGANELYADRAACDTACAGFTDGSWDDTGADSAQCRTYHASLASGDAAVHCPHAGVDGGGVCVDSI